MSFPRRPAQGFTVIEFMVVLSVLAIVTTVAVPGMANLIATQRVRGATTDLHLALMRARSEAIKRNTNAAVVPNSGGWSNGWTVRQCNVSSAASCATTLATPIDQVANRSGVTVTTTAGTIVYTPNGRQPPQATSATFQVSSSSTQSVRCVAIDSTGRPYVTNSAC